MILALMLATASPATESAPPPFNSVIVNLAAKEGGSHCLPGGEMCLELSSEKYEDNPVTNLVISFPGSGDEERTLLPLPAFSGDPERVKLWPHIVSVRASNGLDGNQGLEFLVGVIGEVSTMYSGGGGSGSRLHLLRFGMGPNVIALGDEVLDTVWDSSLMIRACFSEEDMKDRLEACHDDYSFTGSLTAAAKDGGELPALTFRSVATAYPRTSRRSEDNSAKKLKRSDLTHWRDPDCSYTRTLRYNPATGQYEMDRAAPDCSDYTTP